MKKLFFLVMLLCLMLFRSTKMYSLQNYPTYELVLHNVNVQQAQSDWYLKLDGVHQGANTYSYEQRSVHIRDIASNEFKKIFDGVWDGESQYACLGNISNFASESFRAYARGLSCYQSFMLLLSEKIHNDRGLARATECVPGFKNEFSLWGKTKSEFHDFVHAEAARIKQERERTRQEQDRIRQEQEKVRREQEAARIKKCCGLIKVDTKFESIKINDITLNKGDPWQINTHWNLKRKRQGW